MNTLPIVTQKSRNVMIVSFPNTQEDFEQWFMLTADRHHDSTCCDRDLEKRHLDLAASKGAFILDFGDIFDAMQGKNDPRSSYSNMRPEFVGKNVGGYFNTIVEDAAEFYKPYPFLLIGRGNHESSVEKKSGVDLISNLVHLLNQGKSAENLCYSGGYGGWVRFHFQTGRASSQNFNLKYMHGWGGGGPVTRGTIDTNRQAVYEPDADIVVNGHIHEAPYVPVARERLTQDCKITTDLVHFVRTPGYKDSFGDGSGGWDVETGKPPKPRGCYWLRFTKEGSSIHASVLPELK